MKLEKIPTTTTSTNSIQEHIRLKLTTLAPVHIGGRSTLGPNRFIPTDSGGAVVHEEKLFEVLYQKNAIGKYWQSVQDNNEAIKDFLHIAKISPQDRYSAAAYRLDFYRDSHLNPSKIRPFLRNGENLAYLPGTAIKGAIRTALLYGLLRDLKVCNDKVWSDLIAQLTLINLKELKINSASVNPATKLRLIRKVLQNFDITMPDGTQIRLDDGQCDDAPHRDILRAVSVSDSQPIGANLKLCQVQFVSEGGSPKGWHFSVVPNKTWPISVYLEALRENQQLEFEITTDRSILTTLQATTCFTDFFSLEKYLQLFAKELLAFELAFLKHIYNSSHDQQIQEMITVYENIQSQQPNLRLGWGCGAMGITILRLLMDDADMRILDKPTIQTIQKYFDCFNKHMHKHGPDIKYFPKTRRFIVKDGCDLLMPLGWCKLERVTS